VTSLPLKKRIAAGQWSDPWSRVFDEISLILIIEQNQAGWHLRFVVPSLGPDSNLMAQDCR